MDLRRLRAGEWMLAAGSALLLVSLFTVWYEGRQVRVVFVARSGDYTLTAFEAFRGIDLPSQVKVVVEELYKTLGFVLAAGALLGLALVMASAMRRASGVGIAAWSVMALIALGLLLLLLVPTVRIPDFHATRGVFEDSTRDAGIWLGLAGCILMLLGSLAAIRHRRMTRNTRSVS